MVPLKVFNPVAKPVQTRITPAPRLTDLNGKRIGLYWNIKAGGDVALEHTRALLEKRFPGARFSFYPGDVGFMIRHMTPRLADRIAREVDAVIGTTSD
ncbi:MAG: hypothetical protein NZ951_06430 [Dehalococcoidia bacterium]|nr:hypothetical protein [Dehalococcoidia bacterium]MDW8120041.1 hypothetical protein [Chloroflexota bacterium]